MVPARLLQQQHRSGGAGFHADGHDPHLGHLRSTSPSARPARPACEPTTLAGRRALSPTLDTPCRRWAAAAGRANLTGLGSIAVASGRGPGPFAMSQRQGAGPPAEAAVDSLAGGELGGEDVAPPRSGGD